MKKFKVILKKLHRKEIYLTIGLMLFFTGTAYAAGTGSDDPDLTKIDDSIFNLLQGKAGFIFITMDLILGIIMAISKKNYWILAGTILIAILVKQAPTIIKTYTKDYSNQV